MQNSDVRFSDFMSELVTLVRSYPGLITLAVVVIAAINTGFDLLPNKSSSVLPGILISIYGQYLFVEKMLPEYSHIPKRKYGSLFVASLLGGLGILLGAFLLVLPGLFLAARWSISTPFVVTQGLTGRAALKASWDATEQARWQVFLVFLACSGGLFAVFVALVGAGSVVHLPDGSLVMSILSNTGASLWVVGGWCLGVAIFRRLQPASGKYDDVFA